MAIYKRNAAVAGNLAIGTTEAATRVRLASIGGQAFNILSHVGTTQSGDDNIVGIVGYNADEGGVRINLSQHAWYDQWESEYDAGGGLIVAERHVGQYMNAAGTVTRRWLSVGCELATNLLTGHVAGIWQWFNSDRSIQTGQVNETGELQIRDKLYITLGGNKNLIQVEKNTPGSTWVPLQLFTTDRVAIKLADASATDGDIRFGSAFDWKWLISGTTRPVMSAASGIINIGDNNSSLAGINITTSTSGSGFSVYLASQQLIQTAFDGLYLAKTAGSKMSLYGGSPVVQHTTVGQTAGFTAGAGTPVLSDSTFTGGTGTKAYTMGDIVRALKLLGAIASS